MSFWRVLDVMYFLYLGLLLFWVNVGRVRVRGVREVMVFILRLWDGKIWFGRKGMREE